MFEELNDDFVANRERFTKTLSLSSQQIERICSPPEHERQNCLTRVGRPRTTPVSARRLVGAHLVIPDDIACPKGLLGPAESGMTPREARRAGGVGPKPAPVVSAPPRGGPNRLGRSPSAAVVARDRRDTRRAVAPAQNAHGHRRDETPPELGPVDSTISGSPEEPAALDATGSMTNDLRCCETRKLC